MPLHLHISILYHRVLIDLVLCCRPFTNPLTMRSGASGLITSLLASSL